MGLFPKTLTRLSIDLGSRYTRVLKSPGGNGSPDSIPTVYAKKDDTLLLGAKAERLRTKTRLIHPLDHGILPSEQNCLSFLQMLHHKYIQNNNRSWAVLSAPSVGKFKDSKKLVEIASQVFYQALVIPELTMAVFALRNRKILNDRKATLINLGASCMQLALIEGKWPEPKEIIHVSGGGNEIDHALKSAVESILPDITITVDTARRLKEKFAAATAYTDPVCPVELISGHRKKIVDIGPAITKSLQAESRMAAHAVQYLYKSNKLDKTNPFTETVILIGGGAGLPNLAHDMKAVLREEGCHPERIIVPGDHSTLTVQGGMEIAKLLKPEHWNELAT